MWTTSINRPRLRLLGCLAAAMLVVSASSAVMAQDRGSYRDRGERYQRATSSSDVRARTRDASNTRPQYRSADATRSTAVQRSRPAPRYNHIDRGRSYGGYRFNSPSYDRYPGSRTSVNLISQVNIGSGYGYHRPHTVVHRPNFRYVQPYAHNRVAHNLPWHYRPGTSVSVRYNAHRGGYDRYRPSHHYRPSPVYHRPVYRPVYYVPRVGFGFYGVSTGSSFSVSYSYNSSSYSRPGYSHSVVRYSGYYRPASSSISVRYNYRR